MISLGATIGGLRATFSPSRDTVNRVVSSFRGFTLGIRVMYRVMSHERDHVNGERQKVFIERFKEYRARTVARG